MAFAGLGVALVGFLLAAGSIGMTSSNGGRLGLVVLGIIISLGGITMINQAYQQHAIWKK